MTKLFLERPPDNAMYSPHTHHQPKVKTDTALRWYFQKKKKERERWKVRQCTAVMTTTG